jgi:hypothetical protein
MDWPSPSKNVLLARFFKLRRNSPLFWAKTESFKRGWLQRELKIRSDLRDRERERERERKRESVKICINIYLDFGRLI